MDDMKTCDAAFDQWYAQQRHQLSNEQVCRLIWTAASNAARRGGFLPNGTRVMWQSSNGTEFPATITAYNPATYDAVLDDGCDAKGFSRHRFFQIAATHPMESQI